VRVSDDLRKTVIFFGIADDTPGRGGINCFGTGFFVHYEDTGYLVTAKHLANELHDTPFLLRLNKRDGSSENIHSDGGTWAMHPDPTVDVAAIPFNIPASSSYDVVYLPLAQMSGEHWVRDGEIGIGDFTYTVGLFRLMSGEKRNLPVVHFGTIALVPNDERVPVRDWSNRNRVIQVEGYLIETQSLQGLSGAPVFVRPTVPMSLVPPNLLLDPRSLPGGRLPEAMHSLAPRQSVVLLGLWQGSWDAPAEAIVGAGQDVRVPVGMGVVVPAEKIVETLEIEGLKNMRKNIKEKREREHAVPAANPDSALPLVQQRADAP
jgi:hypothetical protein